MELLQRKMDEGRIVCIGLDVDLDKIPKCLEQKRKSSIIFAFNKAIIDATADTVLCYKPNYAFYECYGNDGINALRKTIKYIHREYPGIPVILDFKRGDIGNTNSGSVRAAFKYLEADAVTVNPYLGKEALQPFLNEKNKGIIILCRTSNDGAGEFQDLMVYDANSSPDTAIPLYQRVALNVSRYWNINNNCFLVVGATCPEELGQVRENIDNMSFLIPGIGAQGGDVEKTILNGKNNRGQGMIINSSRGIIYASKGPDFARAARIETIKLHNLIDKYR